MFRKLINKIDSGIKDKFLKPIIGKMAIPIHKNSF